MKITYLTYLKSVLFSVFFLTLPFALMEQFMLQGSSGDHDKILAGIVLIALSLTETFLLSILLGHGIKRLQGDNVSLGTYYKRHLRDLIIESFRGMGRIAVGFLMFIVPGIKRAIEYYLIPYVVQFDVNYQQGKVDALEETERLLKGHLTKFSLILCLTQVVMLGIQIGSYNFNLFTTPVAWLLFYVVEVTVQTCIFLMFYDYYIKYMKLKG